MGAKHRVRTKVKIMFKKDNKFNKAILFYTLVSILGGMLGAFIVNLYFAQLSSLNYFNATETSQGWFSGNNIFNASKKITVAQDENYEEVLNSVKYSVVDIYKKDDKENNKDDKENEVLRNLFLPENFIGNGVVLTNDGWILSYGLENFLKADAKNKNNGYAIVFSGNSKESYNVTEIVKDKYSNLSFLKIDARGLPVLSLAKQEDIKDAETVLLAGRDGQVSVKNINDSKFGIFEKKEDYIKSSDILNNWILISDNLGENYVSAPVINLRGELAGIIAKEHKAVNINTIEVAFKSMLKNKEILRPSLGIEYIDLSKILGLPAQAGSISSDKKGALVQKVALKSSAAESGIKVGDIILKIEKDEIKDNNLSDLIQDYEKGTSVNFTILRGEKEIVLPVVLK